MNLESFIKLHANPAGTELNIIGSDKITVFDSISILDFLQSEFSNLEERRDCKIDKLEVDQLKQSEVSEFSAGENKLYITIEGTFRAMTNSIMNMGRWG